MRNDQRETFQKRAIKIERNYTKYALGSVLISFGETKVLCTATCEDRVPSFLRDSGRGWLTAEYSMLPSSTHVRMDREIKRGKPSGRTNEIQRLIGRSLRSVMDFDVLGERTIKIDADVIQADGGTRTAAISGSMVALVDAINCLLNDGKLSKNPIKEYLAAVSVGVVNKQVFCDLNYDEDYNAEVDMNLVMTESGKFVELQGTAEETPFDRDVLNDMLNVGSTSISEIIQTIKESLNVSVSSL